MKILAIDTSALVATAALCEDETPLAVYSQKSGMTHSQTMLPIIKNIMDNTGTSIDDLDILAVSQGPGSFLKGPARLRVSVSVFPPSRDWHSEKIRSASAFPRWKPWQEALLPSAPMPSSVP